MCRNAEITAPVHLFLRDKKGWRSRSPRAPAGVSGWRNQSSQADLDLTERGREMELNVDIFSVLDKGWALLTAGDSMAHFNTMTVSWGMMGTFWGKPAATVYVRDSRYTLEFMKDSQYFTLTMFDEDKKPDLGILGSKSGRDGNKIAETSLHAKKLEHGVGFEEAKVTLILKKIYMQQMDMNAMPKEILDQIYPNGDDHNMFIGEVVDIIRR